MLDPFETEQRFAEVNDERDDDVWCLRLAVGTLDLQVHRAPMAGTVVAGNTAVRRTAGRNACAGSSNPMSGGLRWWRTSSQGSR